MNYETREALIKEKTNLQAQIDGRKELIKKINSVLKPDYTLKLSLLFYKSLIAFIKYVKVQLVK